MAGENSPIPLLPALLRGLPDMLQAVGRALATVDQEYADFLRVGQDAALAPAQVAMRRLVWGAEQAVRARGGDPAEGAAPLEVSGTAQGQPGPPGDGLIWELFEELGREQRRRQLPVSMLLSAYHLGGRVAWRHISGTAVAAGLAADALAALAEEVFTLVDRLSSVTVAGYVDEQAQAANTRELLRDALTELLLSERPDPAALDTAARRAGWPLPASAAVVLVPAEDEAARAAVARLDPHCLPLRYTALPGAIVPDASSPGRRDRLIARLRGCNALIGPTVRPDRLAESARLAEAAARIPQLADSGAPVVVADHLDTLIVQHDPELLAALRARCLEPLGRATPASRDALRDTLRSWLVHRGDRQATARELGIHPQTVRYRLGRLRELFGPALDEPESRRRLFLALVWEGDAPSS